MDIVIIYIFIIALCFLVYITGTELDRLTKIADRQQKHILVLENRIDSVLIFIERNCPEANDLLEECYEKEKAIIFGANSK